VIDTIEDSKAKILQLEEVAGIGFVDGSEGGFRTNTFDD